jgi:hypothetical protein
MSPSETSQQQYDVGGLGGPIRRLRGMTRRERLVTVAVKLFGSLVGATLFWGFGRLLGDDEGWFGYGFFAFWMFVVSLYEPELVRLFRRMND